jgi:23S rRNA pseudouridine1911/1915/1917 synthase
VTVPETERGWTITPEEFASWIVSDSSDLAVLNKPGGVVCHPSKHGAWSSLAGAAREYFGLATIHMPFRLDRETSGVWLAVKNRELASELQTAVQQRLVRKTYLAILEGAFERAVTVDRPIGPDPESRVWTKRRVVEPPLGQPALTRFEPVEVAPRATLVRVIPATGRLHQIRVHAAWLGHPVVGDKVYGPDETLYLDFIERGPVGRVSQELPLPRQALHCESVEFAGGARWSAPLAEDLRAYWDQKVSFKAN